MLNKIWAGFILIACLCGFCQALVGDGLVLNAMMTALFDAAKTGFEISLGLTGLMCLWLGMMAVGESAGLIKQLARVLSPLFTRLFPDVPASHPATGAITMNIAANMLGLDNAATPLGLKAMQHLQTLNPSPDTASNAQIVFMVINTASVTLFPVSIFLYRAQMGAVTPTDVFIPLLITSYSATLAGLLCVMWVQKIKLLDPIILLYLGGMGAIVAGIASWFLNLPFAQMQAQSTIISSAALLGLIACFIGVAVWRKIAVFEVFVEGAKEGFNTAIKIAPYLIGMLIAIALLRSSGVLEASLGLLKQGVVALGADARFVDGIPTAIMKSLSGSGARAMMLDTMKTYGADSFAGHLVSILQGSSETTFYVLAVYFGAVGIKHTRHAVPCALFADAVSFIVAVVVCYAFFG